MTIEKPDLLKGLAQADVEKLLSLGTRISLASGEELFRLGGVAEKLYLISQGRINLSMPMSVRGKDEEVLIEERTAGQTVGWSALIPPYRYTLRAEAPLATEVIAIPRAALWDHFMGHPDVGYAVSLNLAAVIGQRLQVFQAMWAREVQRMVELRCA